jgi:hypothetical protein
MFVAEEPHQVRLLGETLNLVVVLEALALVHKHQGMLGEVLYMAVLVGARAAGQYQVVFLMLGLVGALVALTVIPLAVAGQEVRKFVEVVMGMLAATGHKLAVVAAQVVVAVAAVTALMVG